MKHLLIILDGATDDALPEFGGLTPLEQASTPHLDRLAAAGSLYRLQTVFPGMEPESLACIMGMLGYDPIRHNSGRSGCTKFEPACYNSGRSGCTKFEPACYNSGRSGCTKFEPACYNSGRSGYEALGRGIALTPGDLIFRCNIVTLDKQGMLRDFTAGSPSALRATELLALARPALPAGNIGSFPENSDFAERLHGLRERWELHAGQSYRNLLIIRNAEARASDFVTFAPHMHPDGDAADMVPMAASPRGQKTAERLASFLRESRTRLAHACPPPIRPGETSALWLWSPAHAPSLPLFATLYGGLRGAVVTGLDFMRGLALAAGLNCEPVPGATGGTDTAYHAKTLAALGALEEHDFVCVHVNATDEAAHARNGRAKVEALEKTDAAVIGPLWMHLREQYADGFTLTVCADHKTRCADGTHEGTPTPLLICRGNDGRGRPDQSDRSVGSDARFTEADAAEMPVISSLNMLREIFAFSDLAI